MLTPGIWARPSKISGYICVLTGRQTPASHDDWDTGWFARFPLSVEFQEGAFVNADDKEYWVGQFLHSGFKHPVDYYRNVDANWRDFAADPSMLGRKIEQPTSFICQCLSPSRVAAVESATVRVHDMYLETGCCGQMVWMMDVRRRTPGAAGSPHRIGTARTLRFGRMR